MSGKQTKAQLQAELAAAREQNKQLDSALGKALDDVARVARRADHYEGLARGAK